MSLVCQSALGSWCMFVYVVCHNLVLVVLWDVFCLICVRSYWAVMCCCRVVYRIVFECLRLLKYLGMWLVGGLLGFPMLLVNVWSAFL